MHKHPLLYINFTLLAIIALLILGINADNINLPQPLKALAQTASQIISGSGTPTSMAQFTGSYTLGNSQIYQDGGGDIGIGTQVPGSLHKLDVIGNIGSNDVEIKNIGLWASQLGNWNFLSNIPAGFADGVDNVGTVSAPHGKKRFTSNGTFTVPNGVTIIWVSMSGGGGGGGYGYGGGGGGGAHAVVAQEFQLLTSTVAITVGVGGSGGIASNGTGGTGGTSSFGPYIITPGGAGGVVTGGVNSGGGGAAGGPGGTAGSDGIVGGVGGFGGGSMFGSGGRGSDGNPSTGGSGGGYGGGGGGGAGPSTGNGGSGTPGFVLVEW